MSESNEQQTLASGRTEAERILSNIRSLRDDITTAWRERAVILTAEERTELRAEIRQTCRFLEDLTRGA